MPAEGAGDYAVGYGKPPLHTRFEKGRSGHPRGRPRRVRSLAGDLLAALEERTEIAGPDGKPRKIAKRRVGLARIADKFAQGDAYDALLRADFAAFAERCFHELYPRSQFLSNWHFEVVAARLAAVRGGRIPRLVVNLPPRHLKSLLASIAFPAWFLGHDPQAEILCVSYAQDLADKWSRDCRRILASGWYRWLFPTRLAPSRQAMAEFETNARAAALPPASAAC